MKEAYAMIMAGGAGTRLWPLSRKGRPKPLLSLVENERSMFQISVERLDPLFPPERVFVVANEELTAQLKKQCPRIPEENFIIEPSGRDTAPAVGLAAIHIRARNPEAVMAVLTADHHIADEEGFRQALETACDIAADGGLVTLGIKPAYPSTGFGYIERGEIVSEKERFPLYQLKGFIEKPDEEKAERLTADPRYSWNSGMFIWPVQRVMDEFGKHAPDIHENLERIAAAIGTEAYDRTLIEVWGSIRKISVDFALMEHIDEDIYVIPVEIGWSDIGNFGTLYDILLAKDEEKKNVTSGQHDPLMIESGQNLVFSDRLVATIGIEDLVIIDTDDVLLVCHKDRVQDVKQLVEELKKDDRARYL